jgi:YHS domain-containing protein
MIRFIALFLNLMLLAAGCGGGGSDAEGTAGHHEGEAGGEEGHGDPAAAADAQASFEGAPAVGAHALCPVSHEAFTVTAETTTSEHEGRTYAFCCPHCKERFDANPAEFIQASATEAPAAEAPAQ